VAKDGVVNNRFQPDRFPVARRTVVSMTTGDAPSHNSTISYFDRPAWNNASMALIQAIARRGRHPESWLWETEDGRQWLPRLVVATLSTFGLKRGVGLETISEFCVRLRLETQVGCSPSA
jgi:hypothetical protein